MWFFKKKKRGAPKGPNNVFAAGAQYAAEEFDERTTNGDALATIAALEGEGAHEALKLVGDVMERNTAENLRALQVALEREESAHSKTLDELREVRKELTTIWGRIDWLLGGDMPHEMRAEFEEIVEAALEQERIASNL